MVPQKKEYRVRCSPNEYSIPAKYMWHTKERLCLAVRIGGRDRQEEHIIFNRKGCKSVEGDMFFYCE